MPCAVPVAWRSEKLRPFTFTWAKRNKLDTHWMCIVWFPFHPGLSWEGVHWQGVARAGGLSWLLSPQSRAVLDKGGQLLWFFPPTAGHVSCSSHNGCIVVVLAKIISLWYSHVMHKPCVDLGWQSCAKLGAELAMDSFPLYYFKQMYIQASLLHVQQLVPSIMCSSIPHWTQVPREQTYH